MMTLHRLTSAAEAAKYYSEIDDYRRQDGRAPTEWIGRGAEALGLRGEIDPKQVTELLEGRLPDGTQLGTKSGDEVKHAPGWDCTFSAPKSVSVAALVWGDDRLVAAHDLAVKKGMAVIEEYAAATRIRNGGEVSTEQTGNIIAAVYRHTTNRNKEAQLHSHAVKMNATMDANGDWRSCESRGLYRIQMIAGEVYRAELARLCLELGYRIEFDEAANGGPTGFRLIDVSREEEALYSGRAKQIVDELEKLGLTRQTATTGLKQAVSLKTRAPDIASDHAELRAGWVEKSKAAGLGPPAQLPVHNPQAAVEARRVAAGAIRDAAAHLGERETRFTPQALEIEALRIAGGRARLDEIRAARVAAEKSGELVARETRAFNTATGQKVEQPGFTTKAGLEAERRMIAAGKARGTVSPMMKPGQIKAHIVAMEARAGAYAFNDSQKAATVGILGGSDRVTIVQGYAGTAKTTSVLAAVSAGASRADERGAIQARIDAAFVVLKDKSAPKVEKERAAKALDVGQTQFAQVKRESLKIVALAPTNSAAKTLGEAIGVEGRTVAGFLNKGEKLDSRTLVIVDEASLISARDLAALMERCDGRVVLVGDSKQLGSVDAGAAFQQLQEAGIKTHALDEIVRQRNQELKSAVYAAIEGKAAEALGGADVVELATRAERVAAIAKNYTDLAPEQRAETLVIAPGRDDRREVNEAIRGLLASKGEIDTSKEVTVEALNAKGLTEVEARRVHSYQAGDVLEATRDYTSKGIEKGERVRVVGIDANRGRLICEKANGRTVEIDPIRQTKLRACEPEALAVAPGDTLTVRAKMAAVGLENGDRLTVLKVDKQSITVLTKDGEKLKIDTRDGVTMSHGYAQTVHESQGRTCVRVLFHAESHRQNLMNLQSLYVALSRAKDGVTIYTDDPETLARLIERETGEKATAMGIDIQPAEWSPEVEPVPLDDTRILQIERETVAEIEAEAAAEAKAAAAAAEVDQVKPVEPVEAAPAEPVEQPELVEPVTEAEAAAEAEPVEPAEVGQTDAAEPVELAEAEPATDAAQVEPAEQVAEAEQADVVEPAEVEPAQPVELAEAEQTAHVEPQDAEQADVVDPVEVEPAEPVEPAEAEPEAEAAPTEAAPVEPSEADQVNAVDPVEVEPTEPAAEAEPEELAAVEQTDAAEPAEAAQAEQAGAVEPIEADAEPAADAAQAEPAEPVEPAAAEQADAVEQSAAEQADAVDLPEAEQADVVEPADAAQVEPEPVELAEAEKTGAAEPAEAEPAGGVDPVEAEQTDAAEPAEVEPTEPVEPQDAEQADVVEPEDAQPVADADAAQVDAEQAEPTGAAQADPVDASTDGRSNPQKAHEATPSEPEKAHKVSSEGVKSGHEMRQLDIDRAQDSGLEAAQRAQDKEQQPAEWSPEAERRAANRNDFQPAPDGTPTTKQEQKHEQEPPARQQQRGVDLEI